AVGGDNVANVGQPLRLEASHVRSVRQLEGGPAHHDQHDAEIAAQTRGIAENPDADEEGAGRSNARPHCMGHPTSKKPAMTRTQQAVQMPVHMAWATGPRTSRR